MASSELDALRRYYQQELTYLRQMGAQFARSHPRIAQRLELGFDETADPHVERLMEGFAFLTGRLQYNIDNEFPEIPTALLGAVYPQFTTPVPSMAIAQMVADPSDPRLASGYVVERGTELFAESVNPAQGVERVVSRFRTGFATTLWPLVVEEAAIESTDEYEFLDAHPQVARVIRIKLSTALPSLGDLDVRRLRFHLHGYRPSAFRLYELLCCNTYGLAIAGSRADEARIVRGARIEPVGFASDEEVLPYSATAHPGYRLVQEYLSFPEKFLFVDAAGLELPRSSREFNLLILLDGVPGEALRVDRDTFRLGCTPIVNLYRKTTEPIRLDHRRTEYRLNPDLHRERTTEIHSIERVSEVVDREAETRQITPYFSYDHGTDERRQASFWYARRVPASREGLAGSETYVSFVDLDFNPRLPPHQTVYAHAWCTNRDLARQLPAGAALDTEAAVPVALDANGRPRIYCLTKPTAQIEPPIHGSSYWRLVSHLSLNYLSLSAGPESLRALREILRVYSFIDDVSVEHAARGIRDMTCNQVVGQIGRDAWRGFCQGVRVELTLEEEAFPASSAFVFASVLNHFFALYAPVNSFTELVLRSTSRDGVWKQWPQMTGSQPLL